MLEYKPLLELFFRRVQNENVIFQGELNKNFYNQEFSSILYKYISNRILPNTIRLFEYNNQVYLVYYWNSSMNDEYGRRIGNFPIIGMSCSKNTFKRNPDVLALKLQNFFMSIIEEVNTNNVEDAYEVTNYFFNMDEETLTVHLKNILYNYSKSTNKLVNKDLLEFVRSQRIKLFSNIDVKGNLTLKSTIKRINEQSFKK